MQISSLALAVALAACAPVVDGPAERQRVLDREDGAALAAQLTALPGVVRAEVVIRRAAAQPLAPRAAAAPPTGVSVVVLADGDADRAAIAASARTLVAAIAPGLAPAILVEAGAPRPRLARVGPFTVEAGSKARLQAGLAAGLALIAGLAGWIGWAARRQRRGNSAQ